MKKIALAIVAAVALTGCGSVDEGDGRVNGNDNLNGTITIQYDGRPLDCIVFEGYRYADNYVCDFVKYHAEQESDFE